MDIVKLISADHIPVKMRRCDLSCPFSAVRIVIASQHILVALCLTICICGFSHFFFYCQSNQGAKGTVEKKILTF